MSGYDMISREIVDRTTMVSYLSQFYELFRKESVERDAGKDPLAQCTKLSGSFLDIYLRSF